MSSAEWETVSEDAHSLAFGEFRPKEMERVDFALLAFKDESPVGYVQCIEMDSDSLYWQWGGAFASKHKRIEIVPCYISLIDWCMEKYKRVSTRIENTNIAMLKLAMKVGFLVIGTRAANGRIYLELLKEG